MHVRFKRGTCLALLAASLGCRPVTLDRSLAQPQVRLELYETVLRAITADFAPARRPPVEVELIPWRAHYDSTAGAVDVEPPAHFRTLPDTFLIRLARAGIIAGICAPASCRRVPNAITLSAPNERGGFVRVQASLAGTGVMQYVLRPEPPGWTVVTRQQLLFY